MTPADLLTRAATLGYPRLVLKPWKTIPAGERSWLAFTTGLALHPEHEDGPLAEAALARLHPHDAA